MFDCSSFLANFCESFYVKHFLSTMNKCIITIMIIIIAIISVKRFQERYFYEISMNSF